MRIFREKCYPNYNEIVNIIHKNYHILQCLYGNKNDEKSRNKFEQIEYGYFNLLEDGLIADTYYRVLKFCLVNNIGSITDIGTAYSSQGLIFNEFGIDYNAINDLEKSTQDPLVEFKSYQCANYGSGPCKTSKSSLAVAILSLGWNCYVGKEGADRQFRQLAKDFHSALIYLSADRAELLKKHFRWSIYLGNNMYFVTNKWSHKQFANKKCLKEVGCEEI